ncbi:copia protein [Tanacetum coccineum]
MKMGNSSKDSLCLTLIDDTSTLWHRRLGHANMRLIQSLSSKELVRNLPKLKFENHGREFDNEVQFGDFCDANGITHKFLAPEPQNVKESIQDESWTMAMQEELNQFKTKDVWNLVPPPENGVASRNKARLVAQGYNQLEGIDFDETYDPVA